MSKHKKEGSAEGCFVKMTEEGVEVWYPEPRDLQFAVDIIKTVKQNNTWVLPASGAVYRMDHANKTLWLIRGEVDDVFAKNAIVFGAAGYKVAVSPDDRN